MRKFSYKTAKLVSSSFLACILLSLSPPQSTSQDVPLLKRIRDYWKEGDYSSAKKQIQIYLERNPVGELSEELRLLLGDLYVREGNFASALEEYALLKKTELKEKSFYNEAVCLYETKNYKELLALTKLIPSQKQLSFEQTRSIKYLCGLALEESKDPAVFHDAVAMFEACKNTPFAPKALASLISLHLSRGDE